MLNSSQFTRPAIIATAALSVGASPALARPSDVPLRPAPAVTTVAHATPQWTPPRVDAMGVRPANAPVAASPAPAVPLTVATQASGGTDWLLIGIGGSTVAALLLAVAVIGTHRHWAHPFRERQV